MNLSRDCETSVDLSPHNFFLLDFLQVTFLSSCQVLERRSTSKRVFNLEFMLRSELEGRYPFLNRSQRRTSSLSSRQLGVYGLVFRIVSFVFIINALILIFAPSSSDWKDTIHYCQMICLATPVIAWWAIADWTAWKFFIHS